MKLMRAAVPLFTLALTFAACDTEDTQRMVPIDARVGGAQDAAAGDAMMTAVAVTPKDVGGTDAAPEDAGADTGDDICTVPPNDDGGTGILNGGFETPVVAPGGFQRFFTGATFGDWTVVGQGGNVATVGSAFAENGFSFASRTCGQTLDLTGTNATKAGVSQTVPTVTGTSYTLSFWVGNMSSLQTSFYGTSSTVIVLVDDALLLSAVNSEGAGATSLTWKQFSVSFIAASNLTKIAFINGDPLGDNSNFLDDVVLR